MTSVSTRGKTHDYDSHVRIRRCSADHRFPVARNHVRNLLSGSRDGRRATDIRSLRESRFDVAGIGTRAGASSRGALDHFASWIQPSWRIRRPRPGGALFGPLGVLAVRAGRGGIAVPIRPRSSRADRRSPRVTVFAPRDCPARSSASRRERLSASHQQLRALLQLVSQRYQPQCSGRTTAAAAAANIRRPVSRVTNAADSAIPETSVPATLVPLTN